MKRSLRSRKSSTFSELVQQLHERSRPIAGFLVRIGHSPILKTCDRPDSVSLTIAASRTPLRLLSGWGYRGRRLSRG
jgi:hypothetical protein